MVLLRDSTFWLSPSYFGVELFWVTFGRSVFKTECLKLRQKIGNLNDAFSEFYFVIEFLKLNTKI